MYSLFARKKCGLCWITSGTDSHTLSVKILLYLNEFQLPFPVSTQQLIRREIQALTTLQPSSCFFSHHPTCISDILQHVSKLVPVSPPLVCHLFPLETPLFLLVPLINLEDRNRECNDVASFYLCLTRTGQIRSAACSHLIFLRMFVHPCKACNWH